jgi:putative cell wall-binding protein
MSGEDRYETAAAISRRSYPTPGVPVVYIASGLDFADALAAAPAAAHQGGPLLLTARSTVPSSTLAELKRLAPQRIVIVGGGGAIGGSVQTALTAIAPTSRIGGADRFETSRLIAERAFGSTAVAYLATGLDFPDGLSAGAAAGVQDVPIVLVNGRAGQLDAATLAALEALSVTEVRIAGGNSAVSPGIAASLTAASIVVNRYGGADRYSTSVALNRAVFGLRANVFVATGTLFPDALSGAAAAGAAGDPLYLAKPWCMPSSVRDSVMSHGATSLTFLGGPGALNDNVAHLRLC